MHLNPMYVSTPQRIERLYSMFLMIGLGLVMTGCEGTSAESSAAEGASKPNIVLIMADDLGYGDPDSYNKESKVPTPNIDRLARQGRRFTDAHTPSSVCTPTRYGLLTGRYAWRTHLKSGVLRGYSPLLIDTSRTTIASFLKSQGYQTAGVGKWHLGLGARDSTDYQKPLRPGPLQVGFDYFYGIPASLDMDPYVYVENNHPVEQPIDWIDGSKHRREGGDGFWRAGPIAPNFQHNEVLPTIVEKASEFVKERAQTPERPFFLYVPLSAPHTPWLPVDRFREKSGAGYYGDFAMQVDAALGQILEALRQNGLTDNTLVIFTSDNGAHWLQDDIDEFGHRANGPLRGQKADIWEGGHRVPFIVRWPGNVEPGTTSKETISLTDLLATMAAIVGAELPPGAGPDSYNVLPAMLGQPYEEPIREATVHHSADGMFAIRQGPWKLIQGRGSGGFTEPQRREVGSDAPAGQLYNLAEDLDESENLYAERPKVVKGLSALLEEYKRQGRSRPRREQSQDRAGK